MKKVWFLAIFSAVFAVQSKAQQDPKFFHYAFNGVAYNPAYAGSGPGISATALSSNHYMGLQDFNPITQNFNIHSAVKAVHGGLGLNILTDKVSSQSVTGVYANYAYRKDGMFGLSGTMSFGINLGLLQLTDDLTKFTVKVNPDPLVGGLSKLTGNQIDIGLGALYSSEKFYAGISLMHLNNPGITTNGGAKSNYSPHLYFTAGYNYQLNSNIELRPTILVKSSFSSTQIDFGGNAFFNQKYWAGLGYSTGDAIYLMAGGYLKGNTTDGGLRIGFSYGSTLNKLASVGGGNNFELLLGYNFKIQKPVKIGPRDPLL